MSLLLANWKTTLSGVLIILLSALSTFAGVHVPGFNLDIGAAIVMALGLFSAKDANVTGGTVPNATH